MAEYIEREALLQDISETVLFSVRGGAKLPTPEMRGSNKVIDRIKSAPTADVVEVLHGEWVEHPEDWRMQMVGDKCSLCGWAVFGGVSEFNYCPNCGAKMDGKGEGE